MLWMLKGAEADFACRFCLGCYIRGEDDEGLGDACGLVCCGRHREPRSYHRPSKPFTVHKKQNINVKFGYIQRLLGIKVCLSSKRGSQLVALPRLGWTNAGPFRGKLNKICPSYLTKPTPFYIHTGNIPV